MAIELTRDVDPTIRARLESLDRVDHSKALELAGRFNRTGDVSTFDREITAQLAQYSKLTRINSTFSSPIARAPIIPLPSRLTREGAAALGQMEKLDMNDPALSERRPGVIGAITTAIS